MLEIHSYMEVYIVCDFLAFWFFDKTLCSIPHKFRNWKFSDFKRYKQNSPIIFQHYSDISIKPCVIFYICFKRKRKMKSLSCVWFFAIPWTVAYQAPLSMGFSRQEYWSGLPLPSPGDLPDPGMKPGSPALQADSLPSEPLEKSSSMF